MAVIRFPGHRKLTQHRVSDLLERACYGYLPIAKAIRHEFAYLLAAAHNQRRDETAQRLQRLDTLLEQYDQHLRKTRARVRRSAPYDPSERPTELINALFGNDW